MRHHAPRARGLRRAAVTGTAVLVLATALSSCLRVTTIEAAGGPATSARTPVHTAAVTPAPRVPSPATPTSTPRTLVAPTTAANPWAAFSVREEDWATWQPLLTDVHPASPAELGGLQRRVTTAAGRSWTATLTTALGPAEVVHRRGHTRVRFGPGQDWAWEVHVEGAAATGAGDAPGTRPLVVCFKQEKACVRLTGHDDAGDKPHLFDNLTDSAIAVSRGLVDVLEAGVTAMPPAATGGPVLGRARLGSPVGPLDCAVAAEDAGRLRSLDHTVLALSGDDRRAAVACVDARGLVVLGPDLLTPVLPFTAFRPGVPADPATFSFPVRAYRG